MEAQDGKQNNATKRQQCGRDKYECGGTNMKSDLNTYKLTRKRHQCVRDKHECAGDKYEK
jgi:hypothetical protein